MTKILAERSVPVMEEVKGEGSLVACDVAEIQSLAPIREEKEKVRARIDESARSDFPQYKISDLPSKLLRTR
jgi:hypothetical protein